MLKDTQHSLRQIGSYFEEAQTIRVITGQFDITKNTSHSISEKLELIS